MKKYGKYTKKEEIANRLQIYKKPVICTVIIMLVILSAATIFLIIDKQKKEQKEIEERQAAVRLALMGALAKEVEAEQQYIEEVNHPTYVHYEYKPKSDEYYEELDLFARVLHCENSNEVDGEMACWKTGSVIVNRVWSSKYPNTVTDVVYDPGQYDCIGFLYREEPTDIEYEVAAALMELMEEGPGSINKIIPENVLYAAEFRQGSGFYDQEGRTIYCYE